MAQPVLLSSGRHADVFAMDGHRVLRRYREGGQVSAEVTVMTYVGALGFPVPGIYQAEGAELVMERVDAPTMRQALWSADIGAEVAAGLLVSLHRQLHALPPRLSPDPEARILHLDLHPGNVLLGRGGPVVIDWRTCTEGPPDLDLAVTALALAQAAAEEAPQTAALGRIMLENFLRYAHGDPLRMLDQAVTMRRADPALTAEEAGLLPSAAALIHGQLSA